MSHELAEVTQPQVVTIGKLEQMLHRVKANHFQLTISTRHEIDVLKARKTAARLVGVVSERVEDYGLERTSPMVALLICRDDMFELIELAFLVKGDQPLEVETMPILNSRTFQA